MDDAARRCVVEGEWPGVSRVPSWARTRNVVPVLTSSCLRSSFYLVERAAGGVLSRTGLAWAPGVERAGRASPPLRRSPSTMRCVALGAPLSLSFCRPSAGPSPSHPGPSCAVAERRCLPVSPSPLCRDLSRYQWAVSKRDNKRAGEKVGKRETE